MCVWVIILTQCCLFCYFSEPEDTYEYFTQAASNLAPLINETSNYFERIDKETFSKKHCHQIQWTSQPEVFLLGL